MIITTICSNCEVSMMIERLYKKEISLYSHLFA